MLNTLSASFQSFRQPEMNKSRRVLLIELVKQKIQNDFV